MLELKEELPVTEFVDTLVDDLLAKGYAGIAIVLITEDQENVSAENMVAMHGSTQALMALAEGVLQCQRDVLTIAQDAETH